MACLGEVSRFDLVRALSTGSWCVTELAERIGLSQSCTTRHLQALEREGVVRAKRDGKRVIYGLCLEQPRVADLIGWALSPHPISAPVSDGRSPVPARGRAIATATRERPTGRRGGTNGSKPKSPAPAAVPDEPRPATTPEATSEQAPEDPPTTYRPTRSGDLEDFLL